MNRTACFTYRLKAEMIYTNGVAMMLINKTEYIVAVSFRLFFNLAHIISNRLENDTANMIANVNTPKNTLNTSYNANKRASNNSSNNTVSIILRGES